MLRSRVRLPVSGVGSSRGLDPVGEPDERVEVVDEHAGLDQPADARGQARQPAAELLHRERGGECRRDGHPAVA